MLEPLSGFISANFITEIEKETERFIRETEAEQRLKAEKKRGKHGQSNIGNEC